MTTCPEHTSHCSAEQSEDHSEPVARRGDLAGAQVDSCPTDSSTGTVSVGPSLALDRISELALDKNGSLTGAVAVDPSTRSRRSRRPVNVARDQLVEYVTDRIVKLERKRHRRKFWIGACGALALPAVLASAAGAWLWFGQEYLPMSPAVLQQIPEPIATWLLSIGVMV